jgi:hypothetical protein
MLSITQQQRGTAVLDRGAADNWMEQVFIGSIGGGALPTDPDPNVTPPAASRIVRSTPRLGSLACNSALSGTAGVGPLFRCLLSVAVATSITIQFWFFDDTQSKWIPVGAAITNTPTGASSNIAFVPNLSPPIPIGSQCFSQIVANTGVEALGFSCV